MEGADGRTSAPLGAWGFVVGVRGSLCLIPVLLSEPSSRRLRLTNFSGRFPTYIITHSRSKCLHSWVTQA